MLIVITAYAFTTLQVKDFKSSVMSLLENFRVVFFEARLKHIT
jgi:hypothetical protein